MQLKQYKVSGMHCASCANIIEKKLGKLKGINSVNVNFATEEINLEFEGSILEINKLNDEIKQFGYEIIDDNKTKIDKIPSNNLSSKIQFSLPITIFIFLIMLWDIGSNLFEFIPKLPIPMIFWEPVMFILSSIFMFWIGLPFIKGVLSFVKTRTATMETLVGISTLVAYIYSSILLLFPNIKIFLNLPNYTYFDTTIVVIGFVTLGKYLESRSKSKTKEAIEKLINLQSKNAIVIRNDKEMEIPIEEVIVSDIVIVKPGSKIPVDGIITEGSSNIDESMISGESMPVDKKVGDNVIGSTMNKQGSIQFRATKVGKDTLLSQIIEMVKNAQGSKAPIQNLVDKVSSIFVPIVLIISILSLIFWLTLGTYFYGFNSSISFGLMSFIGVLVIACPCALGLATPTAIIVGVGKGANNGILIKNATALENLSHINTIIFDKTGTITKGFPTVTDIISLNSKYSEKEILNISASIESLSEHPIAKAIVEKAGMNFQKEKVSEFKNLEGVGLTGIINGKNIRIEKPSKNTAHIKEISKYQDEGKTVVIEYVENEIIGFICISDEVKDNFVETVKDLKKMRVNVVMLTGDNQKTANYIANQVGISEVYAEVLPNEKSDIVKKLQSNNQIVAMVGDGINDAIALMQADIGIAMSTGTDIAIDSAEITLLGGDINKITKAVRLSKATFRIIKQNLFWAFIYNIIGIPLATGIFYPIFGIILSPIFAGLAMAFSSVSVVSNSLRLKTKKI